MDVQMWDFMQSSVNKTSIVAFVVVAILIFGVLVVMLVLIDLFVRKVLALIQLLVSLLLHNVLFFILVLVSSYVLSKSSYASRILRPR